MKKQEEQILQDKKQNSEPKTQNSFNNNISEQLVNIRLNEWRTFRGQGEKSWKVVKFRLSKD